MSSSSSSSSSFFSSSAAAAGAAAAAAAGAAAAPTHHQTSHSPTRSTQDIEDILAVAVGSAHSRPVGSNGVTGGLHEVVEVLLLPRHTHTQRPISKGESSKGDDELLLLNSGHSFEHGHV